ncbi:hypothetical protein PM082_004116 [Marasmius tenuissimus]|nr:hypothetical protein PM082_004116 [Marasmius tenuissimus]
MYRLDKAQHPDLPTHCILRSCVRENRAIRTTCHAVHFICIKTNRDAFLLGRNIFGCLGLNGGEYVGKNAPFRLTVKVEANGRSVVQIAVQDVQVSTPAKSDMVPVANPNTPRIVVAWGQNPVNSELGLGPDEPEGCTKPTSAVVKV